MDIRPTGTNVPERRPFGMNILDDLCSGFNVIELLSRLQSLTIRVPLLLCYVKLVDSLKITFKNRKTITIKFYKIRRACMAGMRSEKMIESVIAPHQRPGNFF